MAAAGVPVAKHGNRSFTSKCGSADVLEALGVVVDLTPEGMSRVLEEAGVVFMFAPLLHPAMRHVVPVRRDLGITTIMNLLGPAHQSGAGRGGRSSAWRIRPSSTSWCGRSWNWATTGHSSCTANRASTN